MAKTASRTHKKRTVRTAMTKTMLLPLPRAYADDLALQAHLALDTLRRGRGDAGCVQTLTQTLILVTFLAEMGYGALPSDAIFQVDELIAETFGQGNASGEWKLDEAGFESFVEIVATYDRQLQEAPAWAIADANDRTDRFQASVSINEDARVQA